MVKNAYDKGRGGIQLNIFFRVLLAIYAFCLTIVSLLSMVITLKSDLFGSISDFLIERVFPSSTASIAMFVIELLFFCMSVVFLMSGFKSEKDKKAMSKYTNVGEIKISLNSIENIALAASRKFNGIKESKAYVEKRQESVSIAIKASVLADINIPSLSEDVQIKVKRAVEESTGIKVSDVKVMVDNIHSAHKSRVE